ncbi:relaxase/mobilization nuclease domain-containing protein [Undibacterium sp. Di26W]|uniref:relaxase/mobilization nuclease domain-containing protein n=1 Tax=Undibacterium sp. Di26W TaxID=3413035 RepID=UPI003BF2555D
MIPFASQRGGGQDLATHLMNAHDNELTELVHLRGAVAADLHGAFKEWQVQADTLTKCKKYLYSLSINPDPEQGALTREQYMDYIRRTEDMLGLADQPRAIVFHTKYGREHCHVAWSRIDADNQKAVHLAFDHDKLMRVTRGFALDHNLQLPSGYDKSRKIGQISLYEKEQERRTGISKAEHTEYVTDAWRHSDDPKTFVKALTERGYLLSHGRRGYVLVDLYGGTHSLARKIDDRSIRVRDLKVYLEDEFPLASLPSTEEACKLVEAHRRVIEKSLDAEHYGTQLAALKYAQQRRRQAVTDEVTALSLQQAKLRGHLRDQHRQERDELRLRHQRNMREVRQSRLDNRPTGLAAFLGRVSGVTQLQRLLARHADARQTQRYLEDRSLLKEEQRQEQKSLDLRQKLQSQDVERKVIALDAVDKREVTALMRDTKRQQRERERDGGAMQPIGHLVRDQAVLQMDGKLTEHFEEAKQRKYLNLPEVSTVFKAASKNAEKTIENREGESDTQNLPATKSRIPSGSGRNTDRSR